jgi:hypothetical protein
MGHCDDLGDALWATAANLVMCYGPVTKKLSFFYSIVFKCSNTSEIARTHPVYEYAKKVKNM